MDFELKMKINITSWIPSSPRLAPRIGMIVTHHPVNNDEIIYTQIISIDELNPEIIEENRTYRHGYTKIIALCRPINTTSWKYLTYGAWNEGLYKIEPYSTKKHLISRLKFLE